MRPGLSGVEGVELCPMRPDWRWCGALPDEAWLALMWRLCSIRPGWRWCEALPDEAVSVEALPDEAWLALM